jgi:hypothetical protein
MKFWLIYISVFAVGISSFVVMINAAPSPESVILGEWKELSWEYEKVNKTEDSIKYKSVTDEVKKIAGENLIIHEAETWHFLPNRRLRLVSDEGEKVVHWRIKGRGHILQLRYDDDVVENYSLYELDNNRMVLNFEIDLQARGIAKLTFEKIK